MSARTMKTDGKWRRRTMEGLVVVALCAAAWPAVGYQVYGAIGEKWNQLGGANGVLGAARSDEADAARGGRFNAFQHGFIYWHPSTGAHAVYGAIGEKWNQLGRERGFGYPLTDELPAAGGGRYNDFEGGGSIYWHPSTGARAVYGAIHAKWHALGRERGVLGYPTSDEQPAYNGGRYNNFQKGMIYWHPLHGARAVYGSIGERWIALGRERGVCGYPTSDEYDFDDGRDTGEYGIGQRFRRSDFTHGYILWSKRQRKAFVHCGSAPATSPQPVPTGEACAVSVVLRNAACLNLDGTPSTILTPGTISATGCGGNVETARARAQASFRQFSCLGGDPPPAGCCAATDQVVNGCLCR